MPHFEDAKKASEQMAQEELVNESKHTPAHPPLLSDAKVAAYDRYFDECEKANKLPLSYDAWLETDTEKSE